MQTTLTHKTSSREVEIEYLTSEINRKIILVQKEKFNKLCSSCRCFNNKYSCPPYSPSFHTVANNRNGMQVICFKMPLSYFTHLSPYHAQRAANAILKGLLDRKLLELRSEGAFVIGSGSCKACKPCCATLKLPCKRPDRKITSLESMGVNVQKAVHDCFGFDLQWRSNGNIPQYICAVGAVLF